MSWRNVKLIFGREVSDQLRDRRTLFMIVVLPILLYPALGIGMMQLTLLFAEQPRTVVILGAKHLPEPELLDGDHFAERWFHNPENRDKLLVVTDLLEETATPGEETSDTSSPPAKAASKKDLHHSDRTDLLRDARAMLELVKKSAEMQLQLEDAEAAKQTDLVAKLKESLIPVREDLNRLFTARHIQVLILIPEQFKERIDQVKQELQSRANGTANAAKINFDYPRPVIAHNSADEKSMIAYTRTSQILDRWERAILKEQLIAGGLPERLPQPIEATEVEIAQDQQISANVWSKIFPALLIIMAVTGAFYPAVDLAAGEKERGTMETLLICPAKRTEIVLGKFFTVMLFSVATALLNLLSLGMTGKYMVTLAGSGAMSRVADLSLPPISSLFWVIVMLIPLSALFSALCLALATFARSSKEGQYYLTPLLMVTMGLTVFCLSPAVEIQPFYSVMPVMGPALLLKALLLSSGNAGELSTYIAPVLLTSIGYSAVAIFWAIDQFGSEEVLFREAERFELGLWIKHLLRDKEPLPTFAEGGFCFVMIMLMQFLTMRAFQSFLNPERPAEDPVSPAERGTLMMQLLMIQQLVIIATPALLMAVMLTTNPLRTLRINVPHAGYLGLGGILAIVLHPLSLAHSHAVHWFFPPLPKGIEAVMGALTHPDLPWWLPILAFAVAPAICEELAFRGFILSGFQRRGRNDLAIGLSALAFGIMHLIPQQVYNATILGLLLGLLAVRSGSLLPGVVFHFVYNGFEVVRNRYGSNWDSSLFVVKVVDQESGKSEHLYSNFTLMLCGLIAVPLILWLWRGRPFETAASPIPAPVES